MKYKMCPKCGEKLTINTHSQLLSSPPQYPIWCSNCGYNSGIDCEEYLKLEGESKMNRSTIEMEDNKGYETDIKNNKALDDVMKSLVKELVQQYLTDNTNDLYFAKVEPNAIIPNKRDEDAGYDIYTCETETIVIPPCSTRMIDTGIAIACSKSYFPKFFDKGGMGSKGIIVGAGVGDSGYRDKYFIPLINTNEDKYVVITNQSSKEIDISNYFNLETKQFTYLKDEYFDNLSDEEYNLFFEEHIDKSDCIIKPLNKAITQFVMLPVPKMNIKEVTYEELKNMKSERGLGKLGSSGK